MTSVKKSMINEFTSKKECKEGSPEQCKKCVYGLGCQYNPLLKELK